MNTISFRVKNSKKAVTPVIATIILIAATIVLALVVGAYTFGLFGQNVKTITTPAVNLYSGTASAASVSASCAGTASLQVSFTNPGASTTVNSVIISGGGLGATTGLFSAAAATVNPGCTAASATGLITGGNAPTSTATIYISNALVSGSTYNYVINFANGQSVSGSLIAN